MKLITWMTEMNTDGENISNNDQLIISVHALTGYSTSQTMRVQGFIKRQSVIILIDYGSTDNFLDSKITK